MFKISSRKFLGLILITYLLLADQHIRQVNGLKCYQCVQGVNYFCDENDMSPISCTNDTGKCAVAYATINWYQYQWRGCVSSIVDTTVSTNYSSFGEQILGNGVLSASNYDSCSGDLCNAPLKCYTCTGGPNLVCNGSDTGIQSCGLSQAYCGKITLSDGNVWKGCMTADQVGNYNGNSSDLMASLAADFSVKSDNVTSSTGFYSCSTSLCNTSIASTSVTLFNIFVPFILSLIILSIHF